MDIPTSCTGPSFSARADPSVAARPPGSRKGSRRELEPLLASEASKEREGGLADEHSHSQPAQPGANETKRGGAKGGVAKKASAAKGGAAKGTPPATPQGGFAGKGKAKAGGKAGAAQPDSGTLRGTKR